MSKTIATAWGRAGAVLADYGSGGLIRRANVATWAPRSHRTYSVAGARAASIHWGQAGREIAAGGLYPLAQGGQNVGRTQDRLLIYAARPHAGIMRVEATMLAVNTGVELELYRLDTGVFVATIFLLATSTTTPELVQGEAAIPAVPCYAVASGERDDALEPATIYLLSVREAPLEEADL